MSSRSRARGWICVEISRFTRRLSAAGVGDSGSLRLPNTSSTLRIASSYFASRENLDVLGFEMTDDVRALEGLCVLKEVTAVHQTELSEDGGDFEAGAAIGGSRGVSSSPILSTGSGVVVRWVARGVGELRSG